ELLRLGFLHLHDQIGLGEDIRCLVDDLGPVLGVVVVGQAGAEPGVLLDEDTVARPGEFFNPDGNHPHAVLVSFDLARHANDHKTALLPDGRALRWPG
ncbi:MAG: hypothetical protein AMXMBFR83_32000, partial [Phycisphaerae bacterium]